MIWLCWSWSVLIRLLVPVLVLGAGLMTLLTPEDIRRRPLTVTRWREGYDADEVGDLLDECADTIQTLGRELIRLGNNPRSSTETADKTRKETGRS